MAVNKPLLPKPPFAPGTFVGDHSRALERELQKLQLAVKQLRDGRIEGVLALAAAPAGGVWAQGDIVQNSAPKRTISASTTFAVLGWQYTDEGGGTLTWAELRFWESMAAGGGGTFAASSMTATTTGVGTSLYVGNAAGELTLRNLQAGSGISLTISAGAVRITNTGAAGGFAATSQTATNVGTGVGLYLGNPAGVLGFSTLKAGTDITLSVSGNEVVIGYTGAGGGFAGSSQTATHTGTGVGVYVGNAAGELTFRKVQAGTGVSVTTSGGAIRIAATGGTGLGATVTASVFIATDFYRVGADQVVGPRKDTWSAPTGVVSRAGFDTASISLPDLAERFGALLNDLVSHGLIGTSLSVVPATWNPADKGSSQSLSSSNLWVYNSVGATWGAVRSTRKAWSGDRYFEVRLEVGTSAGSVMAGLSNESGDVTTYPGATINSWARQCAGSTLLKWNNNVSSAYGSTITTGDVIGIRIDFSTGVITTYKNGVSEGVMYTITASTTLFPMVGVYSTGKVTGRFASTSWSFAPVGVTPF